MPCLCETRECLDVFANLCGEYIELPVNATQDGRYLIDVDFNGVTNRRAFYAESGKPFIAPNLFNGNYRHKVTIYGPDGELFNCYTIKVMPSTYYSPLPYPAPAPAVTDFFTILAVGDAPSLQNGMNALPYNNGTVFVVPSLIGATITDLRQGGVSVEPIEGGYTFDSSTGTITFDYIVSDTLIYIEGFGPNSDAEISTIAVNSSGTDTISLDPTVTTNIELV